MPFVKLDCGILNSTLWFERNAREVFITALLMAEPFELTEPMAQIATDSLENTGWCVPPGWYGFVHAAGVGIVHRAGVTQAAGIDALKLLASPEASSRSQEFDGRRLVRVDGGYVVLNYFKYRDRDYGAAERMRRLRARQKGNVVTPNGNDVPQNVTQAECRVQSAEKIKPSRAPRSVEAIEFETFWSAYPRKVAKATALKAWRKLNPASDLIHAILSTLELHRRSAQWTKDAGQFIPHPASWLNARRWEDKVPVSTQAGYKHHDEFNT